MSSNDIHIIHIFKSKQYLSCKDAGEYYGYSSDRIRELVHEMEKLPRYKTAWVSINNDGVMLVNTLALEDFFRYRGAIKSGLTKHLPPYDPAEVRRQRGEVKTYDTYTGSDSEESREGLRRII